MLSSSSNNNFEKEQELLDAKISQVNFQTNHNREIHCITMLNEYKKAYDTANNDDEKELFHNLRAFVFLELKELRK